MSSPDFDWSLYNDTFLKMLELNFSYGEVPGYTPGIQPVVSISVTIVITVWVVIVNSIFIAAILCSPSLRRRRSSWLLLNLSVADILVGLVVTPLATYYENSNIWRLGRELCLGWLVSDVLLSCVSLFAIFMINLDRFLFIYDPLNYERRMSTPVTVTMIVATWLGAMTVVLPVFFEHQGESLDMNIMGGVFDMCHLELSQEYAVGTSVATYFVPGFVVLCINFGLIIMLIIQRRRRRSIALTPHEEFVSKYILQPAHARSVSREGMRQMRQAVIVMCVVNTVYLAMWFPFFLFNTVMGIGNYNLVSPVAVSVAIWVAYANSGLNPTLWLIYPHIRRAVWSTVCCTCGGRGKAQYRYACNAVSDIHEQSTLKA